MRFESSTDVNASPEEVWAAVHDPEQWPLWVPSVRKVDKVSEGPLGIGSQLRIAVKAALPVKLHMTIKEYVPGQRVVMQGKILGTSLTRFYTLERVGDKTRLAAGGEASGALAWLVCRSGKKLSDDIVMGLKKRVEQVVAAV